MNCYISKIEQFILDDRQFFSCCVRRGIVSVERSSANKRTMSAASEMEAKLMKIRHVRFLDDFYSLRHPPRIPYFATLPTESRPNK